jgi:zinc protease
MADPLVVDGVRLLHVPQTGLGIVQIEVVVEGGSLLDPPGKDGLASLTASMLLRGTKNRSYRQIMGAVNDLGATLEAEAQKDALVLAGDVMPRYLDRWTALVADVLAHSTFPAGAFRQERALVLEDIRALRDDDGELARHFFARFLYRGHPLGRPTLGFAATVAKLAAADCRAFAAAHLRRGNVVVLVAGDVDLEGARRVASAIAAAVPDGPREAPDMPPPPAGRGIRVLVVDKPDRTQSQVVLGHPSIAWRDPDLFPLMVGNTALGGTFTSRLVREIREVRGWSYGVSSSISAGRQAGTFSVGFFPQAKDLAPAIRLALDLLRQAARDGLPEDEVAFARDHLAHQFPFRVETARKRAEEALADLLYDRPAGFLSDYVASVEAQSAAVVSAALARDLHPDDAVVVVVATAAAVEADLKAIPGVVSLEVVPYTADSLPPL